MKTISRAMPILVCGLDVSRKGATAKGRKAIDKITGFKSFRNPGGDVFVIDPKHWRRATKKEMNQAVRMNGYGDADEDAAFIIPLSKEAQRLVDDIDTKLEFGMTSANLPDSDIRYAY